MISLKASVKYAISESNFYTYYSMYHKENADCLMFFLGGKEEHRC